MTLLALLTKEMRLRFRRERTIWIIVVYILLMGLLGWFVLTNSNNSTYGPISYQMSQTGIILYTQLALIQLLLLLFITPSFTTTAINSEKERQTYDMLLCSRLSAFALIAGKLIASLMTGLLLIAASIPLFSLVFFFGGVGLTQILSALLVFVATTFLVGTFGLFCSTLLKHPAISTAITYTVCLLWFLLPMLITSIFLISGRGNLLQIYPLSAKLLFIWNPLSALTSTYPTGGASATNSYLLGIGSIFGGSSFTTGPLSVGQWMLPPWFSYSLISIIACIVLFVLSVLIVKPISRLRLHHKGSKSTTARA